MQSSAMQKALCLTASLTALLLALSPAGARVASTNLNKLTLAADCIVVAKVDEVTTVGGVRVAEATVVRSLRGSHSHGRLAFVAQPTWTCDTSSAAQSETALLFLSKVKNDRDIDRSIEQFYKKPSQFHSAWARWPHSIPLYEITWSGRGRLPAYREGQQDYLIAFRGLEEEPGLWTGIGDVRLPDPLYSSSHLWVQGESLQPHLPGSVAVSPESPGPCLVPFRNVVELVMQCAQEQARLAGMDLRRLTEGADAIALAEVLQLRMIGGVQVAEARVIRSLKGMRANQQFAFIAQPIRLCDFSSAGESETALIFLDRLRVDGLDKAFLQVHPQFLAAKAKHLAGTPLYLIAHAGNGSMTLDQDDSVQYVLWGQFVRLPRGIPTVSEPGLGLLVRLQNLEARVLQFVHAAKRKTMNAASPVGGSPSS